MSFVVSNCTHSRAAKINEQADFGLMTHILLLTENDTRMLGFRRILTILRSAFFPCPLAKTTRPSVSTRSPPMLLYRQPNSYSSAQVDDIVRLFYAHQLCHAMRMNGINVTIGVEDQFAAVFVSLPFGYHLYVNASFNCASDEHAPE